MQYLFKIQGRHYKINRLKLALETFAWRLGQNTRSCFSLSTLLITHFDLVL